MPIMEPSPDTRGSIELSASPRTGSEAAQSHGLSLLLVKNFEQTHVGLTTKVLSLKEKHLHNYAQY